MAESAWGRQGWEMQDLKVYTGGPDWCVGCGTSHLGMATSKEGWGPGESSETKDPGGDGGLALYNGVRLVFLSAFPFSPRSRPAQV